jgi:ribonucleoside-diphosphate reductase alpha chain
MQHGAAEGVRAFVSRNGTGWTPEEMSGEWTCRKRDGKVVPFDCNKIRVALTKCFTKEDAPEKRRQEVLALVEPLTGKVVNALAAQKDRCHDVETVQRFVIQQLWAEGLFDYAEHYQNYRERRAKARAASAVTPEVMARVKEDQRHFPLDLQYYQFMSKFSRWREDDRRRETWKETCHERVLPWLFKQVPGKLSEQEQSELSRAMYCLEASPAMRVVQMAGPALDRCHVGAYNCAYSPIEDMFSLPEMLYVLMQGSGHGFSVESDYVDNFPRVKKQKGLKPDTYVVPDSTEGWCDAFHEGIRRWFDGHDLWFDVSQVRKKGTRLKTKGGRASGPEPLLELLCFARNLFMARQGRFLEDIDLHDLACMTGKIVQVGGVRRASEISLSDLSSIAMRNAKSGNWFPAQRHRSMANNSAVYDFEGTVPVEVFMEEWLALVKSKSGERGIFNRQAAYRCKPARRKLARFGCNPCAEIILRPYEFCNLSIAIARPNDTRETLAHKVRMAAIFGMIQATCTNFRYVRPEWKKNCEEERLLGVDINGHADCPLTRHGAPGREELARYLGTVVDAVVREFAPRFGINPSAANTTVKPSGDSAVFFNCGSGLSPWFADYQIRWVREEKDSPIARFLAEAGVPHAPAPESPESLLAFGFPRCAPPGVTKRNDMTALQQFENWLMWKRNWAEHSVSATIYVEEHEWPELGAAVYRHIDEITGIAFLPKDNGVYTYAPNEELTEEQYREFCARFPDLNWAKLQYYELEDSTQASQTLACVGDRCSF